MTDDSSKNVPNTGHLSQLVAPLKSLRRKRLQKRRAYIGDWALRSRRRCTRTKAIVLAIVILFISVLSLLSISATRWAISKSHQPIIAVSPPTLPNIASSTEITNNEISNNDLSNQLSSMAQTVSGVAGILFAVLVFAIQLQVDRSGQLAPLTRFLHRQSGMIMDSGIVIGLIAAMGTTQLLLAMGVPFPPTPTLIITLIEFLLALGLTLWHLVSMVVSATHHVSAEIVNAVRLEIDDLLDERTFETSMGEKFDEITSQYSWSVQRFGFVGLNDDEIPRFKLKRSGIIADIRLDAMGELAVALKTIERDWEAVIALELGDNSESGPVLVLRQRTDRAVEDDTSGKIRDAANEIKDAKYNVGGKVTPLSEKDKEHIAVLVERTFEVRLPEIGLASDLREVVTTIAEAAEDAAVDTKKREFEERLNMLAGLIECWHNRTTTAEGFFQLGNKGWGFASVWRTLQPIVEAAAKSDNTDIFESAQNFLITRFEEGLKRKDLSHVNEILSLMNLLYRESVRHDDKH